MAAGTAVVIPPVQPELLAPLLKALPLAAVSGQPPAIILPMLSPILRQRLRLLSAPNSEPWLPLLCYDAAKALPLAELVRGPGLEPHPVSGEVEIDWGCEAETSYCRLDEETLQAFLLLSGLGLAFRLVYCPPGADGIFGGWRVGEVTVSDPHLPPFPPPRTSAPTVAEAERQFRHQLANKSALSTDSACPARPTAAAADKAPDDDDNNNDDDDDDDEYWKRYDATPARTPASNPSPALHSSTPLPAVDEDGIPPLPTTSQDAYFARYDDVQPAMDNLDPGPDPDQETWQRPPLPPLGIGPRPGPPAPAGPNDGAVAQPRPGSSPSPPTGSHTIARLERTASRQEQTEMSIKQHVSRTIKSLYSLSRSSGIDGHEFDSLVKKELALLCIVDELQD